MSYSNGIGDLQRILTSVTSGESSPTRSLERTKEASGNITSAGSGVHIDQTHLSQDSALIAGALAASDVRTDKVASLKEAIANGSYKVPSSNVAGKMIDALTD
jgi:flagellar biosynthesis anti-sigma factor FlgM